MLVAIFVALALAPFLFPGTRPLDVAAKVCVFVLLVASYDLLLGYTGIVSFAHTMFFGIGGYGVAIALSRMEPGWAAIALGTAAAVALSLVLSFLIGLFSLRVKAIFFAMITLAVASFFAILASQLSDFTGGEDGITFKVPELLRPAYRLLEEPLARRRRRRQASSPTTSCSALRSCCSSRCCAWSIRRSAACCWRSARTISAPRRSATAP